MQISVISLFPDMVNAVAEYGVVGRAIDRKLVTLQYINPRDFTTDAHRTVDDRPYGGGPGMVMKFAPTAAAIDSAREGMSGERLRVICMSPQGTPFDQALRRDD